MPRVPIKIKTKTKTKPFLRLAFFTNIGTSMLGPSASTCVFRGGQLRQVPTILRIKLELAIKDADFWETLRGTEIKS